MGVYQIAKHGNYYYRFQYHGTGYRGVCPGSTKTEAQRYEKQIFTEVRKAESLTTVAEIYEARKNEIIRMNPVYLRNGFDRAMAKPRVRVACEQRELFKRNYWDDFVYWMTQHHPAVKCMQEVTAGIAEDYIASVRRNGNTQKFAESRQPRPYSAATANEVHAVMIQVFDLLHNETGMRDNPFKSIAKLSAETDSHEPYTVEELRTIFAKADDFLRPVFTLGLFSGLRLGDICTLRKSDLDTETYFISRIQNKTGNLARIPMMAGFAQYLKTLCELHPESEYVLPDHARQYLKCSSTICARVKKFLECECEIDTYKYSDGSGRKKNAKGIHSLRYSFCTLAGLAGIPESIVRSIVGHMTPAMTQHYTRPGEDKDKMKWIETLWGQTGLALSATQEQ